MKISSFIVSMVVVGLFASLFATFYSGLATEYSKDFNSSSFDSYDEVQTIHEQTQSVKEGLETDSTENGITDLVGGFLKKGFAVLQITFNSLGLFEDMTTDAAGQVEEQTGINLQWVLFPLMTIVVIIFVFLIISVLVGRDV